MHDKEVVVQWILAQAAVAPDESHRYLDQHSGQISSPVAVNQTRGAGHEALKIPQSKEKKETADADLQTRRTIAW